MENLTNRFLADAVHRLRARQFKAIQKRISQPQQQQQQQQRIEMPKYFPL